VEGSGRVKFERESWRKLYVAESAEHRLLSVFARGLRDYLLRLAGEDGTILAKTKAPKMDVARLLGVHPGEKKLFEAGFDSLLGVGYLSHEAERLWITKFIDAQTARSPGAKRQAEFKARHRSQSPSEPPVTLPEALPVTSAGDAEETLQIDETRRDETTTPKPPAVAAAAVSDGKIPCPGDLVLTPEQRATLECGGNIVPGWAIDVITQRFVSKAVADPDDRRTLIHWRKCLAIAVSGDWNGPNRPKRPTPEQVEAEPYGSSDGWAV
jgi:hypothetical protein